LKWDEEKRWRHNGGHKAKYRPPREEWFPLDSQWEARVNVSPGMEVLIIRKKWTKFIVYTEAFPAGTIRFLDPLTAQDTLMALARRITETTRNGSPRAAKPTSMQLNYPTLVDYLFDTEFEDGTPRTRATLTVMAGDVQGVKIVLNDREQHSSLWASGIDLDDALLNMEAMLDTQDAPWKIDKPRENAKKGTK